ncbi:hypothetical protein [Chelatococcus reniformis]|uniref:Uncharacterized protein n=1 Tax=Chelatococcus reniformis TaxID=1494448 RepID=A0A916U618_9HYPH|nr:hypothetical protein [Chelatococcus reniformis]GGC60504.1 hypothetical protein GCM10010994_18930 [Chelatococcus reniformis]
MTEQPHHSPPVGRSPPPHEEPSDLPPDPGFRGLIGIVFVIGLIVLAAVLIKRAKDSAALMDCAITHAPSCRALVD